MDNTNLLLVVANAPCGCPELADDHFVYRPTEGEPSRPLSLSQPSRPLSLSEPSRPLFLSEPSRPLSLSEPPRPLSLSEPSRPLSLSPCIGVSPPYTYTLITVCAVCVCARQTWGRTAVPRTSTGPLCSAADPTPATPRTRT